MIAGLVAVALVGGLVANGDALEGTFSSVQTALDSGNAAGSGGTDPGGPAGGAPEDDPGGPSGNNGGGSDDSSTDSDGFQPEDSSG